MPKRLKIKDNFSAQNDFNKCSWKPTIQILDISVRNHLKIGMNYVRRRTKRSAEVLQKPSFKR